MTEGKSRGGLSYPAAGANYVVTSVAAARNPDAVFDVPSIPLADDLQVPGRHVALYGLRERQAEISALRQNALSSGRFMCRLSFYTDTDSAVFSRKVKTENLAQQSALHLGRMQVGLEVEAIRCLAQGDLSLPGTALEICELHPEYLNRLWADEQFAHLRAIVFRARTEATGELRPLIAFRSPEDIMVVENEQCGHPGRILFDPETEGGESRVREFD